MADKLQKVSRKFSNEIFVKNFELRDKRKNNIEEIDTLDLWWKPGFLIAMF